MSRRVILVLQLTVTLAAVAGLAVLVDWREATSALTRVGPAALAAAVVLAAASQVVGAWRLSLILGGCGVPVGFRRSVAFTWVGLFAGNVLPATIGADALYAVLIGRSGLPMGAGLFGLICNRIVNVLVILAVLPWTPLLLPVALDPALPDSGVMLAAAVGAAAAGSVTLAAGLLAWRRWRPNTGAVAWRRLLEPLRLAAGLARRPEIGLLAVGCSLAMLATGAWALLWLANDLVPGMGYGAMLAVLAITLAAQVVPLSINGVGVQEAVFTLCLVQACGWSPADAAAFSLLARLLGIVLSLPGLPATVRILRRRDSGPTLPGKESAHA